MIAIVTSCIRPPEKVDGQTRNFVPVAEREEQTIRTISRLIDLGISRIILADNSEEYDFSRLRVLFPEKLEIASIRQYQFKNKGINELLLLLAVLPRVPADTPILKISGRYYPNTHFVPAMDENADLKVKAFFLERRTGLISTRAYMVRNKAVYEPFLLDCLNELFVYPYRVVGLKSAWKWLREVLSPGATQPLNTSVEFAAARVIKQRKLRCQQVARMGIQGTIAGFETLEPIDE